MRPSVIQAAIVAMLSITACHKPPPAAESAPSLPPAKPIEVKAAKAELRLMPRFLRVTGQLQAEWDAMVASDAAGKVESTPVERGAVVKAGDVLVKLDERVAQMTLREAEASVVLAKRSPSFPVANSSATNLSPNPRPSPRRTSIVCAPTPPPKKPSSPPQKRAATWRRSHSKTPSFPRPSQAPWRSVSFHRASMCGLVRPWRAWSIPPRCASL
jgi:hypothetical protein